MKILILSFYYKPDLCAGSFRSEAFIKALIEKIKKADTIEILTTQPNRYHSYEKEAINEEIIGNVNIKRFSIPTHKSGILDQSRSFYSYYKQCIQYTKKKKYDIIYATSSRLFTAYLGYRIAKKKNLSLYLDIRDIFIDTIQSIFAGSKFKFFIPFLFLKYIEKKTFRYAEKINLVSKGFKSYFESIVTTDKLSYYSNGIDNDFIDVDFFKVHTGNEKIITYAGNIGEGQGLENIVPEIARYLGKNYKIRIFGDGGRKKTLQEELIKNKINNVELYVPVSRAELLLFYKETDYLFLHLNNYKAFEKVLPSKIFEYGATGKPVIAGVSGYAEEFIQQYLSNWLVFKPVNFNDFKNKFQSFNFHIANNQDFIDKFKRGNIMNLMVDDFINIKIRS